MAEPLIFVFTYAFKEGQLDSYEKYLPGLFQHVESNEPRLIAMETYLNGEGTEATTVLIQPDADAQEHHMRVAGDKLGEGYEFMDFTTMTIQAFGPLSEPILTTMRQLAGSGVSVSIKDQHLGGVNRLPDV